MRLVDECEHSAPSSFEKGDFDCVFCSLMNGTSPSVSPLSDFVCVFPGQLLKLQACKGRGVTCTCMDEVPIMTSKHRWCATLAH